MQKKYSLSLRPADFFFVIILIAISIGGFIHKSDATQEGKIYTIEVNRKTIHKRSLLTDTIIRVQGKTGDILVRTKNGMICISESSCPHKICVKTGWIKKPGESIICVPNRLVVRIEGKKREIVDAITE
jgi:hypothetical protein